jgi:hypothetical protein
MKAQLDRLESTSRNLSSETATQLAHLRKDIAEDVEQLLEDNALELKDGLQAVQRSLAMLSSKMEAVPRENIILQNLYFSSMNLREEAIHDPEEGMFAWILLEEEEPEPEDAIVDDDKYKADKRARKKPIKRRSVIEELRSAASS